MTLLVKFPPCPNCGKKESDFEHRVEKVGQRILMLATLPVDSYHYWCVECILDSPKI